MPEILTRSLAASRTAWDAWWGKLVAAFAGVAALWLFGIMGFALERGKAIWNLPETVQKQAIVLSEYQQLGKKLDTVIQQIDRLNYRAMTFTGTGQVGDFDGEPTVQINLLGEASGYDGAEKLRVTNLSSPDSPSLVLKVEGNFRNENASYLIRLSRSAASKLDIRGTAKVKIEPVEGK